MRTIQEIQRNEPLESNHFLRTVSDDELHHLLAIAEAAHTWDRDWPMIRSAQDKSGMAVIRLTESVDAARVAGLFGEVGK
jgi:hypothetical protein